MSIAIQNEIESGGTSGTFVERNIMPLMMFLGPFSGLLGLFILCWPRSESKPRGLFDSMSAVLDCLAGVYLSANHSRQESM